MNQRTTALAAILAVAVIALAGVGYATFSGTTTNTGNNTTADWIVVEGVAANGYLQGENIIFDTINVNGGDYTYKVAKVENSGASAEEYALVGSPQIFAKKDITIKGNNTQANNLGFELSVKHSGFPTEKANAGDFTGFHLMVSFDNGTTWKEITNTRWTGDDVLSGTMASGTKIYQGVLFGAYGDVVNSTAKSTILNDITLEFFVTQVDPNTLGPVAN